MAESKKEPWTKRNPKAAKGRSRKLSPAQKAAAKRSAKKAGRPYPSLVDNMNAAKKSGGKKASKKAARKSPAKKSSTRKKSSSKKSSAKKTARKS